MIFDTTYVHPAANYLAVVLLVMFTISGMVSQLSAILHLDKVAAYSTSLHAFLRVFAGNYGNAINAAEVAGLMAKADGDEVKGRLEEITKGQAAAGGPPKVLIALLTGGLLFGMAAGLSGCASLTPAQQAKACEVARVAFQAGDASVIVAQAAVSLACSSPGKGCDRANIALEYASKVRAAAGLAVVTECNSAP